MTEATLKTLLEGITPPDEAARAAAHAHWASLAKPLGGLGALETTLESAAALTGSAALDLSKRAVLVLCADNGVVAQGVSQTDQSVTRTVAENLAARRTSVCQMARTARCEVVPVDMGMAGEPVPGVRNCRVASGTTDFTQGPAMRREQAVEAVAKGIALVRLSIEEREISFSLKEDRADVIIPSAEIFLKACEYLKCESIMVPNISLADSIVDGLYEKMMAKTEE